MIASRGTRLPKFKISRGRSDGEHPDHLLRQGAGAELAVAELAAGVGTPAVRAAGAHEWAPQPFRLLAAAREARRIRYSDIRNVWWSAYREVKRG